MVFNGLVVLHGLPREMYITTRAKLNRSSSTDLSGSFTGLTGFAGPGFTGLAGFTGRAVQVCGTSSVTRATLNRLNGRHCRENPVQPLDWVS